MARMFGGGGRELMSVQEIEPDYSADAPVFSYSLQEKIKFNFL
jgi:hypothetical protein